MNFNIKVWFLGRCCLFLFWQFFDMMRLLRKNIPMEGKGVSKKKLKLSTKVKSTVDRKHDKCNVKKPQERISLDLKLSRCFMEIFLSLFKVT